MTSAAGDVAPPELALPFTTRFTLACLIEVVMRAFKGSSNFSYSFAHKSPELSLVVPLLIKAMLFSSTRRHVFNVFIVDLLVARVTGGISVGSGTERRVSVIDLGFWLGAGHSLVSTGAVAVPGSHGRSWSCNRVWRPV